MASDRAMQQYYERDRERDRLDFGVGLVEFERTVEILERTLPAPPATIADIGGGPGRYTDWLVEQGYTVVHRDIVPHHVDQIRARHGGDFDTAVNDACQLDIPSASCDGTLLLGPLYHLPQATDRKLAVSEAARITKPGGILYGASINRWALRLGAMLVKRAYVEFPQTLIMIDDVEAHGVIEPVTEGGFTGYAHTPAGFAAEFDIEGLSLESLVGVEGAAALFTDEDVETRLANETDRAFLFDSLRATESVPELLGTSAHLLATVRRQ